MEGTILTIQQDSLFLPYRDGELHLRRISPSSSAVQSSYQLDFAKTPILMLHGAMSNGRVFYSHKGRGLACFLARLGFTVYVLDSCGRGLSTPKLSRGFELGQGEVIREQLPLAQEYILNQHPDSTQVHWCGHSWGGVLMASAVARFPHLQSSVRSLLTFGSKRTIRTRSIKKWLMVDLVWNRVAPGIASGHGYLAADRWKMGMDNESKASLLQSIDWVRGDWIDHDDEFDYAQAAKVAHWPMSWFIAGANDPVLGNPRDVQDMVTECGIKQVEFSLLSRANGFKHDYGHADMLTHIDCEQDHFVKVGDWYLGFDIAPLRAAHAC